MEILDKKKYILFLPGIFIEDCIDQDDYVMPDYKTELILPSDSESEEEETIMAMELNSFLEYDDRRSEYEKKVEKYDPIPKYFIDAKSWVSVSNLLCSFCHMNIPNQPFPIALNQIKLLIPDEQDIQIPDKVRYDYNNKYYNYALEKGTDDLSIDTANMKEVKAYKLHNIAFCDVSCAVSYIKRVTDNKIINRKETIQMTLEICKQLTGQNLSDIIERELWTCMKQYCGDAGQSKTEYKIKKCTF